jgi:adenylosuccinate synthase
MLDVLKYLDEIPLCVAYEIDGIQTDDFPVTVNLNKARPVYEYMKGWRNDISQVRNFDNLPSEAQSYIRRIEELVQVPIRWISVGPQRDAIFER